MLHGAAVVSAQTLCGGTRTGGMPLVAWEATTIRGWLSGRASDSERRLARTSVLRATLRILSDFNDLLYIVFHCRLQMRRGAQRILGCVAQGILFPAQFAQGMLSMACSQSVLLGTKWLWWYLQLASFLQARISNFELSRLVPEAVARRRCGREAADVENKHSPRPLRKRYGPKPCPHAPMPLMLSLRTFPPRLRSISILSWAHRAHFTCPPPLREPAGLPGHFLK
jgi:hypothetical protein